MSRVLIRIKQYLDLKGVSIRAFELRCGFSNGSFASQLRNGKTMGVDRLENILNAFPDINAEWLLTGKGDMLNDLPQTTSEETAGKQPTATECDCEYHTIPQSDSTPHDILLTMMDKIEDQAKQIGRLEAKIEILQEENQALKIKKEALIKELTSRDAEDVCAVVAVG